MKLQNALFDVTPEKVTGEGSCRRLLCSIGLAVIGFILFAGQTAFAQAVVTPTCPQGYALSGGQCVLGAPVPTCPAGYVLSGGQCIAKTVAPRPQRPVRPASPTSDWDDLGCSDLWFERNQLFAHYGHCFTSPRGRKAFHNVRYPNVCAPPFGKLPPSAKTDVAAIKRVERRKGCR